MSSKQNTHAPTLYAISLAIATLLATACSSGIPLEQATAPLPEVVYPLPQGAVVAIFPFKESHKKRWRGSRGAGIAEAKITQALSKHKVDGKPYFDVLDSKKLNRLLGGPLSQRQDTELTDAAQAARMIGFEYVASGSVSYDSRFWHHDINILRAPNEINSGYNPGLSPYQITVACQVVEITATLQLQLSDAQTAEIKYTGQAVGHAMVDACEEEMPKRAREGSIIRVTSSRKKVIAAAVDRAIKQFIGEILPAR